MPYRCERATRLRLYQEQQHRGRKIQPHLIGFILLRLGRERRPCLSGNSALSILQSGVEVRLSDAREPRPGVYHRDCRNCGSGALRCLSTWIWHKVSHLRTYVVRDAPTDRFLAPW